MPKPSKSVSESLKTPVNTQRPILYPQYKVELFCLDPDKSSGGKTNPLTADKAKEVLGWIAEPEKGAFGGNFLLTDRDGVRVRCLHNLHNRPFYVALATDWMLAILHRAWCLNGETIILDWFGDVQDGQHRLTGLIWAVQEWRKDQDRPKPERRWTKWDTEPVIDALIFAGISPEDRVVNTIGTGKPRTLEDALYRCEWFVKQPDNQRKRMSICAGHAVKFLYERTAQSRENAPRRSHQEAFDFIERHPRILDCVKFIFEEDKDNGSISKLLPLGCSAALLYLMGASATNDEDYRNTNNEAVVSWEHWAKAQDFWADFSGNGQATEALREVLLKEVVCSSTGTFGRDWKIGMTVKAWHSYLDGSKVTTKNVWIEHALNPEGQAVLEEQPSIGGVDILYGSDLTD